MEFKETSFKETLERMIAETEKIIETRKLNDLELSDDFLEFYKVDLEFYKAQYQKLLETEEKYNV